MIAKSFTRVGKLISGFIIFIFFSCQTSDLHNMAVEICECYSPLVSLYERAELVGQEGEEFADFFEELNEATIVVEDCAESLRAKYEEKVNEEELEDKLWEEMDKLCPDIVEIIREE